ncbi:MAG TPA: YbhB/YbcL family Raf kinase inhibitor-like protein [Ruminococcaceae bacterium]|mgnify:FL=1|jgi:hypothetical protein|nr:YbhB/YbcL family Raf kinase inhibitor-like protein [Oscillospiraceae bacterium]
MTVNIEKLEFTCPGLQDGGKFPPEYTGRGADTSPEFIISNLSPQGKTVAITLDDIKNQFLGILNHWVIWNIPAMAKIPGAVPAGKEVPPLGGAVQGVGYGRHKYAGPKPPRGTSHIYRFDVYVLDCTLNLKSGSGKKEFLSAAEGHILQHGSLTGAFE